uniref:Uncharacterized protein n=1 Tax=Romanomermis culicivorax TaxID=13658 RepID=A0A915L6D1_ROMCU
MVQPTAMDAETNMTMDQMLMDIPKKAPLTSPCQWTLCLPATLLPSTTPIVDPPIYLATPAILLRPPIIATRLLNYTNF